LHQIARVGVSPSRSLKLFGREIIFDAFQPILSRYLNVTDGQTDGRTDGLTDDFLWHNRLCGQKWDQTGADPCLQL